MRRLICPCVLILLVLAVGAPVAGASDDLFDPDRHMRVAEVRPGMKGYGLSVFRGDAIERFDVEVVSVLRNFNPKRDVVLIRCAGQNLEHTGAVAGMSGSPIYLRDDAGRERLIGAFAYGWALTKDPIAGVQPIEYMLRIGQSDGGGRPEPAARGRAGPVRQRWDARAAMNAAAARMTEPAETGRPSGEGLVRTLAPVGVSGVPGDTLRRWRGAFEAQGFSLLQSGAAAGAGPDATPTRIIPGGVVITPLLTGDVQFHANGTCTEVIGDRVFAFGHPFNNEGEVELPMAGGTVNAIVASIESSFKIAAMGAPAGAIEADETTGIAGRLGPAPTTVPIEIRVDRGGTGQLFKFEAARHPRLLPILVAVATDAALQSDSGLPQYNTLAYRFDLSFGDGRAVVIDNVDVNVSPPDLMMQVMAPLAAAAENPFERALPTKVSAVLKLAPEARDAQLLSVQLPKTRYGPGDEVSGFVTYRPFRGDEANLPFTMRLPRDLPDGPYQLVIGDWQRYLADEATATPFRFTAETADEVFSVLNELLAVRRDALYVRLLLRPDGVAVGRVAMNRLPSSRRQVFMGAGRSNVTPFVSSDVTRVPTGMNLTGSAEFTLQVEARTRVEAATTRPAAN